MCLALAAGSAVQEANNKSKLPVDLRVSRGRLLEKARGLCRRRQRDVVLKGGICYKGSIGSL